MTAPTLASGSPAYPRAEAQAFPVQAARGLTRLFWTPPVFLLAGLAALSVATRQQLPAGESLMAAALGGIAAISPWLLLKRGIGWDPVLGGAVWVLAFAGIITVARVAPDLLAAQLAWVLLGFGALLAMLLLPGLPDLLRRYKYTWLLAGLLLAGAAMLWGVDVSGTGARLWLQAGPILLQPSEVLRLLLVVFLAAYLAEKQEMLTQLWVRLGPLRIPPIPYLLPLLTMVGLAILIMVFQRDLGPVLLYFGTFLAMFYIATGNRGYLFAGVLLFGVAGFAGYSMSEHIQARFDNWIDPWADPQGAGYQTLQAIAGLAFGGIAGRGPGYGYPTLIPAAHTDYTLVAFGEEWGLVGTIGIILVYAILVIRGLGLAARSGADRFAQLLAAGLAVSLGVQVFIILGGSLRVIPLSGITAPFLSYGGSAMVTGFAAIGLLMRAVRDARREEEP